MKSNWLTILVIAGLLGLLVLLAGLQYQWLGQISDSEKIRLEERLIDDTKRFAEEFNGEIQKAYFLFQMTEEDWNSFSQRYKFWKSKTEYKELIKDFYFLKTKKERKLSRFNKDKEKFEEEMWTEETRKIAEKLDNAKVYGEFEQDTFALLLPVHSSKIDLKKSIGNHKRIISIESNNGKIVTDNIIGSEDIEEKADEIINKLGKPKIEMPEKEGFLIILLDQNIVKNELLPDLTYKYFAEENDSGSYKVSITNSKNEAIFQTHGEAITNSDVDRKLFDLDGSNLFIFAKDPFIPTSKLRTKSKVVWSNSVRSTSVRTDTNSKSGESIDVNIIEEGDKPNEKVFRKGFSDSDGIWTLSVQHIDGSLDQFITNTRRKNLGISFGILSLLAVSIIFIFLSSQRAKMLAQKQMDFVSSVSHEFRTPLAVIYSASENLSDGVIDNQEKISDYGNLIKREGKKLSGMVEQILEFAGAKSGNRKYDFRNVSVSEIINQAINECQPVLDEKEFVVKKEIPGKLPAILADEKALTLTLQNLINNSVKYSNGSNWIKISAENVNEKLRISVADKGIGISDKELKQIFEPFYRAENVVDEQISGNGLGLSLVKQIVDAHGGDITVKSEVGVGSEFIIELPLNV